MHQRTDLYTLTTGTFPARYYDGSQPEGPVYGAQLMFTGPDAAIEVLGEKITPYMFGKSSDSDAFAELIENYRRSILKQASKLRKSPADRVVFTGVWHHVDFCEEPRFEPYVIHVVSGDDQISTSRYKLEMFDYDYPGEGFKGMLALKATSASAICDFLKTEAARISRAREMSHDSAGFKPLQGVIWYPAEDNDEDDLPIVVSKLFTVTASDLPPDYDIDVFPAEAATPSRVAFEEALMEANERRELTTRLVTAFNEIFSEAVSEADKRWVLRKFSQTKFGVHRGEVVLRENKSGPITLSDLANSSTASGSWFQVRYGEDIHEPLFASFDDDDRCNPRSEHVVLEPRKTAPDGEMGCTLATEWTSRGSGSQVRYLAGGIEPRLSW